MKIKKLGKKYRFDYIAAGIRHRRRFRTREEAEAEMARIKVAIKDNTYVDPAKIPTFKELSDDWFNDRLATSRIPGHGYRPSTLAHWQTHIDKHLVPAFGSYKANKIAAATIRDAISIWSKPTEGEGEGTVSHRKRYPSFSPLPPGYSASGLPIGW